MSTHRLLLLTTGIAFGCSSGATAPTAPSDNQVLQASVGGQVLHHVSAGTPDLCALFEVKPGCDANLSLVALQHANGTTTGQWQDQFAQSPGFGGGLGIHVAVNCLRVIGNQAWVSGVVTHSRFGPWVGLDAVITVVDNGRGANDPPDQIGFSQVGHGVDCNAAATAALRFTESFPTPQGQVVVR